MRKNSVSNNNMSQFIYNQGHDLNLEIKNLI